MTVSTRARLERVALIGLPLSIGLVLLAAIDRDPAHGVTFSNAPFSDEGWRALNARNLVDFVSSSFPDASSATCYRASTLQR